jgi:hypothetical protein
MMIINANQKDIRTNASMMAPAIQTPMKMNIRDFERSRPKR